MRVSPGTCLHSPGVQGNTRHLETTRGESTGDPQPFPGGPQSGSPAPTVQGSRGGGFVCVIVQSAETWWCLIFTSKLLTPPHIPTSYGLTSYPGSHMSYHYLPAPEGAWICHSWFIPLPVSGPRLTPARRALSPFPSMGLNQPWIIILHVFLNSFIGLTSSRPRPVYIIFISLHHLMEYVNILHLGKIWASLFCFVAL